jgi:hypothetical protein
MLVMPEASRSPARSRSAGVFRAKRFANDLPAMLYVSLTVRQLFCVHESDDKKKAYCVYDVPSPQVIRRTARRDSLLVDTITEARVLDLSFCRSRAPFLEVRPLLG